MVEVSLSVRCNRWPDTVQSFHVRYTTTPDGKFVCSLVNGCDCYITSNDSCTDCVDRINRQLENARSPIDIKLVV